MVMNEWNAVRMSSREIVEFWSSVRSISAPDAVGLFPRIAPVAPEISSKSWSWRRSMSDAPCEVAGERICCGVMFLLVRLNGIMASGEDHIFLMSRQVNPSGSWSVG